jgi:hypothetical protein
LTGLTFADDAKSSKKAASTDEEDGPLLSVVLLQKKLPTLSEKSIAGSIEKAWKQKVSLGDDDRKMPRILSSKEAPASSFNVRTPSA